MGEGDRDLSGRRICHLEVACIRTTVGCGKRNNLDNLFTPAHYDPFPKMEQKQPTTLDKVARLIYAIAGIHCLGVASWFLLFVSPFNPYGFWGFLVAGFVLLIVSFGASAKDILLFPFP